MVDLDCPLIPTKRITTSESLVYVMRVRRAIQVHMRPFFSLPPVGNPFVNTLVYALRDGIWPTKSVAYYTNLLSIRHGIYMQSTPKLALGQSSTMEIIAFLCGATAYVLQNYRLKRGGDVPHVLLTRCPALYRAWNSFVYLTCTGSFRRLNMEHVCYCRWYICSWPVVQYHIRLEWSHNLFGHLVQRIFNDSPVASKAFRRRMNL